MSVEVVVTLGSRGGGSGAPSSGCAAVASAWPAGARAVRLPGTFCRRANRASVTALMSQMSTSRTSVNRSRDSSMGKFTVVR